MIRYASQIRAHVVVICGLLLGLASCSAPAGGGGTSGTGTSGSVPAAPTDLSASVTGTTITLTWIASAGATAYTGYFDTTSDVSKSSTSLGELTSGSALTQTFSGGTTYTFIVTASNATGESDASTPASVLTVSDAPTGLTLIPNDQQLTVTWNASAGASGYNLYWRDSTSGVTVGGSGVTQTAGAASGLVQTGLTDGTPRYFVVTAVNASGESAASDEQAGTPAATNVWNPLHVMPAGVASGGSGVVEGQLYVAGGVNGGSLTSNYAYDPVADSWATKTSMTLTARGDMQSAVAHGKLFIMGGEPSGCPSAEVGIYDPHTNAWTSGASMPANVCQAGAAEVNGTIYVIGGSLNLTSTYAYSVANDSWTTKASMPTGRALLAVAAADGIVYAIGGTNGPTSTSGLATVEAYDTAADSWTTVASLPQAMSYFVQAFERNGHIIVAGGLDTSAAESAAVYDYDPAADTWTALQSLPVAMDSVQGGNINGTLIIAGGEVGSTSQSTTYAYVPIPSPDANTWATKASMTTTRGSFASAAISGKIYVTGGYDGPGVSALTEVYDPRGDSWSSAASMSAARGEVNGAALDGKFYAVGGFDSAGSSPTTLDTLEQYDPIGDSWSTKASMTTPRGSTGTLAVNGLLYVVGGHNAAGTFFKTLEVYNPSTNSWSTKTPMTTARATLCVAEVNGVIYAIGGTADGLTGLAANEAYSPTDDTWTAKTAMPTAQYATKCSVINGLIYISGGELSGTKTNLVQVYDPIQDSWSTKANLTTARYVSISEAVDGILYVIGGHDGSTYQTVNEAYTP